MKESREVGHNLEEDEKISDHKVYRLSLSMSDLNRKRSMGSWDL
jgi:hypothetical protein